MDDRVMAMDMLKDSKFCIMGIAKAAAEAPSTEMRDFLKQTMDEAVQEHFHLSDILITKGWYQPLAMVQQLQADMKQADSLRLSGQQNNQQNAQGRE